MIAFDDQFLALYAKSLDFKDVGLIFSALSARQGAVRPYFAKKELQREAMTDSDRYHYVIGKANEAVLLGYHLGDGNLAYEASLEAQSDVNTLREASEAWQAVTGTTVFNDILTITKPWSKSFNEYRERTALQYKYFPSDNLKAVLETGIPKLENEMPWWEAQAGLALANYSRESKDMDAGNYGAGMSILHCILSRALNQFPGYDINDIGFAIHLLDDYVNIALKHCHSLYAKFQRVYGANTMPQRRDDIIIVLDKPMIMWKLYMPDMPEKDKGLFSEYYQQYWLTYAMFHCEDELRELGGYFPGAMTECSKCGKRIPVISPICRYCGAMRLSHTMDEFRRANGNAPDNKPKKGLFGRKKR